MLKQQGVFDNHKKTSYSSRVNIATTISGFLQGNHQNSGLPINQIVFNQVTDFPIHEQVLLRLATPRRSSFMSWREKEPEKSATANYVFKRSSTKDA